MKHTLALALVLAAAGQTPAEAGSAHCPPGLAKKNPPCVPPGLARRGGDDRDGYRDGNRGEYREGYEDGLRDGLRLARGDRLPRGEYILIRDPSRYGLDPYRSDWRYYLVRDMLVRADPDTLTVLAVIGLADRLLN